MTGGKESEQKANAAAASQPTPCCCVTMSVKQISKYKARDIMARKDERREFHVKEIVHSLHVSLYVCRC